MPQIKVILNPTAQKRIPERLYSKIGENFTSLLEQTFDIVGKNDVAFDILPALYTLNEADVQIEILYTAGEDEYKTGKPFDPDEHLKDLASQVLKQYFCELMAGNRIPDITVSVWIRPQHHSKFYPSAS
jgi:hypothetical protein